MYFTAVWVKQADGLVEIGRFVLLFELFFFPRATKFLATLTCGGKGEKGVEKGVGSEWHLGSAFSNIFENLGMPVGKLARIA